MTRDSRTRLFAAPKHGRGRESFRRKQQAVVTYHYCNFRRQTTLSRAIFRHFRHSSQGTPSLSHFNLSWPSFPGWSVSSQSFRSFHPPGTGSLSETHAREIQISKNLDLGRESFLEIHEKLAHRANHHFLFFFLAMILSFKTDVQNLLLHSGFTDLEAATCLGSKTCFLKLPTRTMSSSETLFSST